MSRSSLPRRPSRFRRGAAGLVLALVPFTMAGACEEEGAQVPGVEQEGGEQEGGEGEGEGEGEGDD